MKSQENISLKINIFLKYLTNKEFLEIDSRGDVEMVPKHAPPPGHSNFPSALVVKPGQFAPFDVQTT